MGLTDAIAALAATLGKGFDLARPWLDDAQAQRITEERNASLADWADALSSREPGRINAAVGRVCQQAGRPTGYMGAESIACPVVILDALISIAVDKRAADQQLAALIAALQKAKQ